MFSQFMVNVNENKLYYSIGEVAKMFNVQQSLIRHWEKEFDILQPKRNRKGNRLFRVKDIENLKKIHFYIKEKGLTLKGAKLKLKEDKTCRFNNFEIVDKLKRIRQQLINIKDAIQ